MSRKRSRFDEVASESGGEFGRDSREDRGYRERSDRHERSRTDERERRDREHGESRHRDSRDSRDSRDREDYKRHRDERDHERDRERYDRDRDYGRDRDGERERERVRDGRRDYSHRDGRSSHRGHRDSRDSRDSRDYDNNYHRRDNRRSGSSGNGVEIPFDLFLRLSPWRGPVTPLEERPRHLKNWDVAPSGFERISADKAKLTGLFPPPGNIAKTSNYVPPTLDPARAAMFQLLNKDNALPASASSANPLGPGDNSTNLPANLLKQAKRFYVGNLPYEFSESALMSFLETNLRGLSGNSNNNNKEDGRDSGKVLNITVSTDRSYAFVECRTAEDASLAMNLDGVIFEGSQLKIRRPKEYHLAITSGLIGTTANVTVGNNTTNSASTATGSAVSSTPINSITANAQINKRQLIISDIPDILTAEHVKSLLSLVADVRYFLLLRDRETDKSLGVAVFEFVEDAEGEEWSGPFLKHSNGSLFMGPFEMKFSRVSDLMDSEDSSASQLRNLLSVYNLQPGYATAPSSTPILQLLNIVTRESLQADYDAIFEDIRTELSKFSTTEMQLIIPKPSDSDYQSVPGVGKVFVKFGTVEEAAKAASELAGRIFDGHTCIVSFFPPEKFEKRLF